MHCHCRVEYQLLFFSFTPHHDVTCHTILRKSSIMRVMDARTGLHCLCSKYFRKDKSQLVLPDNQILHTLAIRNISKQYLPRTIYFFADFHCFSTPSRRSLGKRNDQPHRRGFTIRFVCPPPGHPFLVLLICGGGGGLGPFTQKRSSADAGMPQNTCDIQLAGNPEGTLRDVRLCFVRPCHSNIP